MQAHYEVPIEQVWDLALDYRRYPEWNVGYEEITGVTGPPDQVGTKIHGVMRLLGRRMEGTGEVTHVERPRHLRIAGKGPAGTVTTEYRFTPAGKGTDAEVEIEYDVPAGYFGKVADKLFVERSVERTLRHSLDNFTALLEAEALQPA
jgi:uncharacterized membrane protein